MSNKFSKNISFVQKVVIYHPTDDDKILILHRNSNDKSRSGDLDTPGGSVHKGEIHLDALTREVTEETKLYINNIKPILVKTESYENDYFLFIGYSAKATSDEVILDSKEHQSYKWMTIEDFVFNNPNHILNELFDKI